MGCMVMVDRPRVTISSEARVALLAASGLFAYSGDIAAKFREYATHTRAHNTLTIDGAPQQST